MKISVIIPTYKPQSYIWECLDSLCSQTFPKDDFEVILVLNGCKKPYDEQIREYISKHPDVQWNYIQTDQGGVSNARNIALDVAKGEYVTFIDDDDYVSPNFLKRLLDKATPNIISIAYPYYFYDGKPEEQVAGALSAAYEYCVTEGINSLSSKARKFFSGPWMKLFHKSFIQGKYYDTRFSNGEDNIYMFLISDKIKKVAFTKRDATYFRRLRENSAMNRKRSKIERINNNWKSIVVYTKIFFSGHYSLYFFSTRVAAEIIGIFKAIVGKSN